jgi:hypothetical protein
MFLLAGPLCRNRVHFAGARHCPCLSSPSGGRVVVPIRKLLYAECSFGQSVASWPSEARIHAMRPIAKPAILFASEEGER